MPDRILVVVHALPVRLGRLGPIVEARGFRVGTCCPLEGDALPRPEDYRAVAVLGGPMSANDDLTLPGIARELDWIPRVLSAGIPYLGICLGAQMLARALGASVKPNRQGTSEIGYYPVYATEAGRGLFTDSRLTVYHWHMEGFDLPAGTELLAHGQAFPNQAFRYNGHSFGLQFHPEVTLGMMIEWQQEAANSLAAPGAQCVKTQHLGYQRHHQTLGHWFERFLDHWLSGDTMTSLPPSTSRLRSPSR